MKKLIVVWIVPLAVSITFAENDVHFSEWGIPQWGSFHPYPTMKEFVEQTKLAGMDTLSPMFFPMSDGNIRSFTNLVKRIRQVDNAMRIFPYMIYPEPGRSPANVERFVHPKGYIIDKKDKTKLILQTFEKSASIFDESFIKLICQRTEKMVGAISPYIVGLIWDEPGVSCDFNELALASWRKFSGVATFPKNTEKFPPRKDDIRKYMLASPIYKKYFDWRTRTWVNWLEKWAKAVHKVNPSLRVGVNVDDTILNPNRCEDIIALAKAKNIDIIVRDPYFWGIPYLFESALLGNLAGKYNKVAGIFVGTSKSIADCFGPPEARVQPAIATTNGCSEIFYYFCNQLKDPQVRPALEKGIKRAKEIRNFINITHSKKIGQIKILYNPYLFDQKSWCILFGISAKYSVSVATLPLTAEELNDCKLLIIPSATPLSKADRNILIQATKSGLYILSAERDALSYDENFLRVNPKNIPNVVYLPPDIMERLKGKGNSKWQKIIEKKIDNLMEGKAEFSIAENLSPAAMVLPTQGQGKSFADFAGRWFYSVDYLTNSKRTTSGFLIANYSPSQNLYISIKWKGKLIKASIAALECKFLQIANR